MFDFKKAVSGLVFAGLMAFGTVTAQAAPVEVQRWNLFNHPDGGARPPTYGLRLDGLFGTPSSNIWTFSFEDDNANSRVTMRLFEDDVTGTFSLNINGIVNGGENSGSGYSVNSGDWLLDFTYRFNVDPTEANDDFVPVRVTGENAGNNGTITALFTNTSESGGVVAADVIDLVDEQGGHSYSFLYANDDHRCGSHPDELCSDRSVGRGWLNHSGEPHVYASDFLFTGEATAVPLPASAFFMLAGIAGLGALRIRKNSKIA